MRAYSDEHVMTISPSQWVNAGWIAFGLIGFQFVLPPLLALVKILEIHYTQYAFHRKSILVRKGILTVDRTEVLKYRIKSIRIHEPFWMRIFGLSNVYIRSSDPYQPELMLYAIPKGIDIRKGLREEVYHERRAEQVSEFDFFKL